MIPISHKYYLKCNICYVKRVHDGVILRQEIKRMCFGGIDVKRSIIKIHEEKCNGCGICATACHEGAIEIIGGVARLVSDIYCDGLGDCLPGCPTGAIEMIERDALEYSQDAVDRRMEEIKMKSQMNSASDDRMPCGCPGSAHKSLKPEATTLQSEAPSNSPSGEILSELRQWPIQMMLINPHAPYLQGADILIAADCTAFAYGDFHRKLMKGRVTIIACPKLDDNQLNAQKMTEILLANDVKSVTVARMEVPCCGGIVAATQLAIQNSGKIIPYAEVTISSDGKIVR
jgi:ferredoxin